MSYEGGGRFHETRLALPAWNSRWCDGLSWLPARTAREDRHDGGEEELWGRCGVGGRAAHRRPPRRRHLRASVNPRAAPLLMLFQVFRLSHAEPHMRLPLVFRQVQTLPQTITRYRGMSSAQTPPKRVFPPLYASSGSISQDRLAFFHILERLKVRRGSPDMRANSR